GSEEELAIDQENAVVADYLAFVFASSFCGCLTAFYLSVWIAVALGFVAWEISSIDFGNC
ncbi:hypothetical protein ACKI1O_53445, partial [Streptomyces scabiei]